MPQYRIPDQYAQVLTTVFKMILIIGLFTWGGHALDGFLHIKFYLFTLIFSIFGIALAIYMLIKDTKPDNRENHS